MKKGFTLIEVIGILVLLVFIVSITFPVVSSVIKSSKEKLYNDQKAMIVDGAKSYVLDLTEPITTSACVSIDTLLNGNYLKGEIKDPRTDTDMDGSVLITYNTTYKSYDFTYREQGCA